MVDDALKFVPLPVIVKEFPPAVTEVGLMLPVVGTGLLIVKVWALDVPPPGVGLVTVIEAVPAVAISAALMMAVSWVEEAKVVDRAEPLKLTVEEATKLVPLTVKVNDVPPAVTGVGEIDVVVGTGLLMVKVWADEVPPPGAGVTTVTDAVPAVAISIAGTMAVISVEET